MSKAMTNFVKQAKALTNAAYKFTSAAVAGQRILPSRNKDSQFQCRIDAGHYDTTTKKLNITLQVNAQPKSPALQEWIKKNSTHGNLAKETFDTEAEDKEAEYHRVLDSMMAQAKNKLG